MLTQKPLHRSRPEDWHRELQALRQSSTDTRDRSFDLRQETSNLRNELQNKFEWDCHDNTTRLDDRVYEVKRVRKDLLRSLQQINTEIQHLENAKVVAEREIEAHLVPIEVALECLTFRERRREGDLVRDDVEIELEREEQTLERSRSDLEKLVLNAVEQLRVLKCSRQRLEQDIKDKSGALEIDIGQATLTISSPQISFKPDPMTIPKDSLTPVEWIEHSTDNMKDADLAIRGSQSLRDSICVNIQRTRREDDYQTRASNFSLRRRLHQETRAKDELQWQKEKVLQEIQHQEEEIVNLERHLRESTLPLKLAQTRLENRKWRPGKDLVDDSAEEGLRAEVEHLRKSRDLLRENLALAKEALHALQNKLRLLDADLIRKNLSVNLEKKCQGTRQKLQYKTEKTSQTEKNLTLTGSLRLNPTQILT